MLIGAGAILGVKRSNVFLYFREHNSVHPRRPLPVDIDNEELQDGMYMNVKAMSNRQTLSQTPHNAYLNYSYSDLIRVLRQEKQTLLHTIIKQP